MNIMDYHASAIKMVADSLRQDDFNAENEELADREERLQKAAPDLLRACRVAREEILEWCEVMSAKPEDNPRTFEALSVLDRAIAAASPARQ